MVTISEIGIVDIKPAKAQTSCFKDLRCDI